MKEIPFYLLVYWGFSSWMSIEFLKYFSWLCWDDHKNFLCSVDMVNYIHYWNKSYLLMISYFFHNASCNWLKYCYIMLCLLMRYIHNFLFLWCLWFLLIRVVLASRFYVEAKQLFSEYFRFHFISILSTGRVERSDLF